MIQDRLGRTAVRYGVRYLRARYRRELRISLGIGLAALLLGAAAYLTRREVPEA